MRGLQFITKQTYNGIRTGRYMFDTRLSDLSLATCSANISRDTALINSLCVKPTFRNRRIGSALLKYTEEFLWNKGVSFININLLINQNIYIDEFYAKNGYNTVNIIDNIHDDGEYIYDMVHMNKIINMDNDVINL